MPWQQVGPLASTNGATIAAPRQIKVTGRVTAVVVKPDDPRTLFVGTARGGLWRSRDSGGSWEPTSDAHTSLAIGALAVAPSNPNVLYAGTGEGNLYIPCKLGLARPENLCGSGLLVSTDAGDSWSERASDVFGREAFFRIAVDPNNAAIVYAASTLGLHRSRNSGQTWERMNVEMALPFSPAVPATDVLVDPDDVQTVYAAFWGSGIYRTTKVNDDKPAWENILKATPALVSIFKKKGAVPNSFWRVALASASNKRLWALLCEPSSGDVAALLYSEKTAPANWTAVAAKGIKPKLKGFAYYALVLTVDPQNPDTIYAGAEDLSRFSLDRRNNTWTFDDIGNTLHADHHAVVFDPHDPNTIYFGNDGGIFRSTDGGRTIDDSINKGLCTLQVQSIARLPNSQTILFGTHDNGAQILNGGTADTVDDGDIGAVRADPLDPRIAYITGQSGPRKSTGGAASGTFAALAGFKGYGAFYPPFDVDPTPNSKNIAYGAKPFVNVDPAQGANSWPHNAELKNLKSEIVALTFVNSNLILAGTSAGTVYYVTQNAGKWNASAVSPPPKAKSLWVCDIKPLKPDGSSFVIALSGFDPPHVLRADGTTPAKVAWRDISGAGPGALPDSPATALAVYGQTIFVGTDIGVYATSNDGKSWSRTSDKLPNAGVNEFFVDSQNGVLLAATNGRGIWELPL